MRVYSMATGRLRHSWSASISASDSNPEPIADLSWVGDSTVGFAVTDTPERLAVARDSAAGLRRALAQLPGTQARAVAMAGIYGMTARQVAVTEGIPLGTAKTRIRDGMLKLRAALLPEDVDDE